MVSPIYLLSFHRYLFVARSGQREVGGEGQREVGGEGQREVGGEGQDVRRKRCLEVCRKRSCHVSFNWLQEVFDAVRGV